MNCINCGAPPNRGKATCAYCQTPVEKLEPKANRGEFVHALQALESCDFDDARVRSVRALSKLGFQFTAGQVRRLADCCDFDDARNGVLKHLIPCTLNPVGLLAVVDIFDFDDARTELLENLVRAGVKVSPRDVPDDEEEDSHVAVWARPAAPPAASSPSSTAWRAGVVAACLVAIWLLLHLPLS